MNSGDWIQSGWKRLSPVWRCFSSNLLSPLSLLSFAFLLLGLCVFVSLFCCLSTLPIFTFSSCMPCLCLRRALVRTRFLCDLPHSALPVAISVFALHLPLSASFSLLPHTPIFSSLCTFLSFFPHACPCAPTSLTHTTSPLCACLHTGRRGAFISYNSASSRLLARACCARWRARWRSTSLRLTLAWRAAATLATSHSLRMAGQGITNKRRFWRIKGASLSDRINALGCARAYASAARAARGI